MKYIKLFNTEIEYNLFINGEDFILPNLSVIKSEKDIVYYYPEENKIPIEPDEPELLTQQAGDVAYWDGNKVITCSFNDYKSSLGVPVGVVVIPKKYTSDGKTRIIALKTMDSNGNVSTNRNTFKWGPTTDISLINHNRIPLTDNQGSTTTSVSTYGYLPSDNFNGNLSYIDGVASYSMTYNLIPSPYSGDALNNEYCKQEIENYYNGLSDLNGLSNTKTLVELGTNYAAANACWNYTDGVSNLQWYLPALGELGYMMVRFKQIQTTMNLIGGMNIGNYCFWSSTEYSTYNSFTLTTTSGGINGYYKTTGYYIHPFSCI